MYIESEIRKAVVTYSELPENKVFLESASEGTTRPYIVVKQVSNVRRYSHQGFEGMAVSRFQIDISGSTYEESKLLAKKVLDIDQYTSAETFVIQIDNQIDGFNDTANNYTSIIDIMVKHKGE
jgi:hypothetical protein